MKTIKFFLNLLRMTKYLPSSNCAEFNSKSKPKRMTASDKGPQEASSSRCEGLKCNDGKWTPTETSTTKDTLISGSIRSWKVVLVFENQENGLCLKSNTKDEGRTWLVRGESSVVLSLVWGRKQRRLKNRRSQRWHWRWQWHWTPAGSVTSTGSYSDKDFCREKYEVVTDTWTTFSGTALIIPSWKR